jgi:anaerobic selenocysteine-containing dehydrogenase
MSATARDVVTTCPLDCWDACSIVARVEDGRVVSLRGNPAHPLTAGFLCSKTMRYPERVYGPERILHPMERREHGRFERISWDAALDRIAGTIELLRDSVGSESIFHLQAAGSMGFLKKLSLRFFSLLGGVTEAAGDICFGAGHQAMVAAMGEPSAHDPRDVLNSRGVVFWGRDPLTTNIHMVPLLKGAKRRGARLVSVNPIRIDSSGLFDVQIQPRPGKDCFLALHVAKRLLEEGAADREFIAARSTGFDALETVLRRADSGRLLTLAGVEAREAEALVDAYRRRPTGTWIGSGVQHHPAGVEVMAILLSLGAMTGNVGVPGGGVSFYHRHRKALDASWLAPGRGAAKREVPAGAFWRHLDLLEPPIRMMWVNGANPVHGMPNADRVAEAIRRIPFVVAVDFHWTETAKLAHLVLPATSFLEEDGIVTSYGQNLIGRQRRVIEPVGEARSDLAIFQALAERLGFGEAMAGGEETWIRRVAATLPDAQRRLEALESAGFTDNPALPAVPHSDGRFATPSGRFEFPARLDLEPFEREDPPPEFPLHLLTPKGRRHHLSQALPGRLRERCPIRLHPDDASRSGVRAGECVRVASARAEIEAVAQIDPALSVGVAVMELTGGVDPGNNVNRLTGDETARGGMTPAYYHCFVRVIRAT